MDAGPLRDILTVCVGAVAGVLSATFGVGGAVISTPGIRVLGASALLAVGTTLPSILPSAATGTVRYARAGIVDWRAAAWCSATGVPCSVGGSYLSHAVPGDGHPLMLMTAALLAVSAWRLRPRPQAAPAPGGPTPAVEEVPARRTSAVLLAGSGAVAGTVSGLLGIGGGVVLVPLLGALARMPLRQVIATSLVCVGVFAVPGTVAHAALGDIDWRFALELCVGVIPGARVGSALVMRAGDRRLRVVVASGLGLIAVVYATGEAIALA